MIPKIIHYCWFGNNPLPNDVKQCIQSWKKYAPEFEIKEWNESNFDVFSHPFMKAAYEAKAWAFVSDYARLKIIYDYGGVYLDTDVELLKPIDSLLEADFYIGVQQGGHPTTGLGYGATQGNKTVLKMLQEYDKVQFSRDVAKEVACPLLNSKILYAMGYVYDKGIWEKDGVVIYGPKYFDPIAQGNTENLLSKESFSIHHYAGSWTSKNNKLKRKIIRVIGAENIYRLKVIMGRAKR